MAETEWVDVGSVEELSAQPLQTITAGRARIALSFREGRFGAVSAVCNHAGGPLGEGRCDGDYIVCPWHGWKFHCATGEGEPGFEEDRGPLLRGPGRERPGVGRPGGAHDAQQEAARSRIRSRASPNVRRGRSAWSASRPP